MTKFTVSSTFIKSSLKQILLTISLSVIGTSSTLAATIRGTLTADIHYGLFYGKADGSELTFVGRNEHGSAPWGTIPNISSSAQFLDWPASNTDSAIFRTKEPVISEAEPVPEPSSVLGVLAFGAFGAAFQRKRKRQKKALDSSNS